MERRRFLKALSLSAVGCLVPAPLATIFQRRPTPITFTAEANDPAILGIATKAFREEMGGDVLVYDHPDQIFEIETEEGPMHVLTTEVVMKKGEFDG